MRIQRQCETFAYRLAFRPRDLGSGPRTLREIPDGPIVGTQGHPIVQQFKEYLDAGLAPEDPAEALEEYLGYFRPEHRIYHDVLQEYVGMPPTDSYPFPPAKGAPSIPHEPYAVVTYPEGYENDYDDPKPGPHYARRRRRLPFDQGRLAASEAKIDAVLREAAEVLDDVITPSLEELLRKNDEGLPSDLLGDLMSPGPMRPHKEKNTDPAAPPAGRPSPRADEVLKRWEKKRQQRWGDETPDDIYDSNQDEIGNGPPIPALDSSHPDKRTLSTWGNKLEKALYDEFMEWWPNSIPAQERTPQSSGTHWTTHPHEPITHWMNVEDFLNERYPEAATNATFGYEHARPSLKGTMLTPEEVKQYGYSPQGNVITQAFLNLHNKLQGRTWASEEDQRRFFEMMLRHFGPDARKTAMNEGVDYDDTAYYADAWDDEDDDE